MVRFDPEGKTVAKRIGQKSKNSFKHSWTKPPNLPRHFIPIAKLARFSGIASILLKNKNEILDLLWFEFLQSQTTKELYVKILQQIAPNS